MSGIPETWCERDGHKQFECFIDFNDWLDGGEDEAKAIRIANGLNKVSQPSKALFAGDKEAYEQAFRAYRVQRRHEVLSGQYIKETFGDDHWFERNELRFDQLVSPYPWTGFGADDYAAANIGQVKNVFSFDVAASVAAVTGFTATAGIGEIDLAWSIPAHDPVTSITVQQSTDGGTTWTTVATLASSATSYAATGLDPAQSYEHRVVVNDVVGSSTASATSGATAPGFLARYVAVSLGTNLFNPMKVTSSGYVLGQSSSYTNYYVWSNGTNNTLQPNSSSDIWAATDIDNNGRVVGLENTTNSLYELAAWAPGNGTASITNAPAVPWYFSSGSTSPGYYYNALVSPGHVWSGQLVYLTISEFGCGSVELEDGFEDTTELGSFSASPASLTNFTGSYSGTQVKVLASNDSDQALLENGSNFGSFTNFVTFFNASPHTTTYTVGAGGPTVPFSPLANGYIYDPYNDQSASQGTFSNAALGKTYVLGSDRTESWDGSNQPVYSAIAHYYCWDGTTTYTLPQPGGSFVVAKGVNAATASVPSGSTNATVAATQIIGNYGSGAYLWEMGATTNTAKSFNAPVKLNALLATNSGWNVTHAASLNDNSAIAAQGIYTQIPFAPTTNGLLMLPCQFSLLNGDTNPADVDGVDFNGNRPTTISATVSYATGGMVTTCIGVAGTTNTPNLGNYNDGLDVLGVDTPIGRGRGDGPHPFKCYTHSLMMLAKVAPPAATNITYGWNRTYQIRGVTIINTSTNTWYVNAIDYSSGIPNPVPDNPNAPGTDKTIIPSTNGNVVVFYDNPAMSLPDYAGNGASMGDYAYQKFKFTYSLTNSIGSANAVATQQVGTFFIAKRTAMTGVVASDWTGISNIASTTNIPDCSGVTTNEIRAIVGGTNTIILDANVTNNF